MNILQIHCKYKYYGGEDFVIDQEKYFLEREQHKVTRYIFDNQKLDNSFYLLKFLFKFLFNINFKEINAIKNIVKKNDINIVHIHNLFPQINLSILKEIKNIGIPIFMTLHNYRIKCINGSFFLNNSLCELCKKQTKLISIKKKCFQNSYFKSFFYYQLITKDNFDKKLISYVDKFIVFSDFHKFKFKSMGVPKSKIIIKPNFIENKHIDRNTEINAHCLFIGRTDHNKGMPNVINFWAINKQYTIDIVGEDTTNLSNKFLKYNNIRFHGHVDQKKINDFLKCSKILIFPSVWFEGFPITILQAMNAGIPILSSNRGVLPEIIKNNDTGVIFNPDLKGDFENKLIWMYSNYHLCINFAKNAKEYSMKYFNPQLNIKKLIQIYQNI